VGAHRERFAALTPAPVDAAGPDPLTGDHHWDERRSGPGPLLVFTELSRNLKRLAVRLVPRDRTVIGPDQPTGPTPHP
jgi:hypothetical protein